MNRETIKFRCWNPVTKDMLPPINAWEFGYDECYGYHFDGVSVNPDKVILMQYTGYNDAEGKEIYDGDILEGIYTHLRTIVRWGKAYSGFQWCECLPDTEEPGDFYRLSGLNYKKVVGNIYEDVSVQQ